jgi:hypothetical protein
VTLAWFAEGWEFRRGIRHTSPNGMNPFLYNILALHLALSNFRNRLLPPLGPSLAHIGIHAWAAGNLKNDLDGEPWTSRNWFRHG